MVIESTIIRYAAALGYEFIATFKKMPAAKMARAQAISVRHPTKRSKPVSAKKSPRAKPRSK